MLVWLATGRADGSLHARHRAAPLELAGLRRAHGRTAALDGQSFTVEPGSRPSSCCLPMATPARMLLGHAAPWELPASAAVTLAAAYGLVRLAGRAYFGTILRFGRRVTVREALRP